MGKPDLLPAEVDQLLSYLAEARNGQLSLVLRTEQHEGFDWIGEVNHQTHACESGGKLTIYTSGTTGRPKQSVKDVQNLLQSKRGKGTSADKWLLTYHPCRWAGLSVMTHVIRWDAKLVVPQSLQLEHVIQAATEATHVSFTPSMFRKMLVISDESQLSRLSFKQITFGGEPATQSVLDTARRLWPHARVSHTYASTEHGDVCSVSDGMAGIPQTSFSGFDFSPDGELYIGGVGTGDIWKLSGHRYHFVGRREETVNVGGAKVFLATVDQAALEIEDVRQARAFAIPNALLGQLVGLEYVGDIDPRDVREALRTKLPKVSCPATVTRVESIPLSQAGKVVRR